MNRGGRNEKEFRAVGEVRNARGSEPGDLQFQVFSTRDDNAGVLGTGDDKSGFSALETITLGFQHRRQQLGVLSTGDDNSGFSAQETLSLIHI